MTTCPEFANGYCCLLARQQNTPDLPGILICNTQDRRTFEQKKSAWLDAHDTARLIISSDCPLVVGSESAVETRRVRVSIQT